MQIFHQFIADTGNWAQHEFVPVINYGFPGCRFNDKIIAGGMADDTHHAGRITGDAPLRFADQTNDAVFKVLDPADIVNDGMILYAVKQGIDGQYR